MNLFRYDPSVPITAKLAGLNQLKLNPSLRASIITHARSRTLSKNDKRIIWAVLWISVFIVFVMVTLSANVIIPPKVKYIIYALIPGFILGFISYLQFTRRVIKNLKDDVDQMKSTGRLVYCIKCKYNLFGSTSLTCPECGQDIAISIEK